MSKTPEHPKAIPGPATEGAQKQIDAIEEKMAWVMRRIIVAGVVFLVAVAVGAWQIAEAFNDVENERKARSNAAASINTFLCKRIDAVGNGVAALITVSLKEAPPPSTLSRRQRRAYYRYRNYAVEQERPPRCERLAKEVAIITGANPSEVVITPIHLTPPKTVRPPEHPRQP